MQCDRRRRRGSLRVRTAESWLNSSLSGFGRFKFASRHSSRDVTDWISAYCAHGRTGCDQKYHGMQSAYILHYDNDKLLMEGPNATSKLLTTS